MQPPKVSKYPIIGIDSDSPDSEIKPGFFRSIYNALPLNNFGKTGIKNVKGTTVLDHDISAPLPTDPNCIGTFTDKANNRIIYFIYSGAGDHGIWYFNPDDNTHTLILQSEFLNFNLDYPITGVDCIEDVLQWTDGNNEPRSIIVSRAIDGLYTFNDQESFEKQCSLYKPNPSTPPTVGARGVGTSGFNNITSDSFQFCYQYVYYDNTVSKISPLSKISPGDVFPIATSTKNYIPVTISIDPDLVDVVKKVYLIYVKNDDSNFCLFKEIDNSTPTTSYTVNFYNTDTVQVIPIDTINFIPNKSDNLLIHEQRTYLTQNEFDYADADVTLTLGTAAIGTITSGNTYKMFPPNSSISVGVVYFDRYGRTNGVITSQTVRIGNIKKSLKLPSDDQNIVSSSDQVRISYTVSGTPPSWAKSMALVMKQNNTLLTSYSCLVMPYFYKREDTSIDSGEFLDNGSVFYSGSRNGYTKQLYLKVPVNLPFSLDGTFNVRLLNNIGQQRDIEPIIEIRGDKVILGSGWGVENWNTLLGTTKGMLNVMFEKYKEAPDEFYFETGIHYDCSDGLAFSHSGTIEGDYYYIPSKLTYGRVDSTSINFSSVSLSGGINYGGDFGDRLQNGTLVTGKPIEVPVISQSPVHGTVAVEDTRTTIEKQKTRKVLKGVLKGIFSVAGTLLSGPTGGISIAGATAVNTGLDFIKERPEEDVKETITVKLSYTPDYNKIANDSGRAWVDVRNKKVNHEPNTLSISDPYVVNSNLNGLSDFRNLYQIPISRTPIKKLVNVGSNVLLAIHERNTTAIATYIGGKVLNTTDGTQLLSDGSGIIGYHNELQGGYGTLYPDSVVVNKGKAYWFDPYSGEIIRYSNGITPLARTYNMKTFFREKGDQFIDTTGRNVIAGYDSNLDMVYFTFLSDNVDEEVTIAFLDKQGEERFFSFYDFIPEKYAQINDKLYSFIEGEMWQHNSNETRNLFYGEQFETSLQHTFNADFNKEKLVRNIGLDGNKKWNATITVNKVNGSVQSTRLFKSNYVRKDDLFYADLRRDENTLPAPSNPLINGQPLIGKVYNVTLTNDETDALELNSLNYGYIEQTGHRIV